MTNLRTESTSLNLDLRITRLENGYRAEIFNVTNGQGVVEFNLPAKVIDQAARLLSPAEPDGPSTYPAAVSVDAVQAFGNWLFQTVLSRPMQGVLADRLEHNSKLYLRLNLSDAPALSRLPWEFLYYPKERHFFSLHTKTPLVRYHPPAGFRPPLALTPPLKILVMIALPKGDRRLDADQEWARLCHQLQALQEQDLITLERVAEGTGPGLKEMLKQGHYHIFHYVGCMDHSADESWLVMPSGNKGDDRVKGEPLADLLGASESLRLGVFSTYDYQSRPPDARPPNFLQTLARHALPAVVGFPVAMTEEATGILLYTLYYDLAKGSMVDAALCRARNHIFAQGNDLEWGVPHLHLCYQNGRIFDIAVSDAEGRQYRQVQHFYNEAVSALSSHNLSLALEKLRLIQLIDPAHPEAQTLLGRISRARHSLGASQSSEQTRSDLPAEFRPIQLDIEEPFTVQDERFNRVEIAFIQRDWKTAVIALEEILEDTPDSVEAAYLLQRAKQQAHLDRLYADGRALLQKGYLAEALSRFQEIQATDESAKLGQIIVALQTSVQRRAEQQQVALLYKDFQVRLYDRARAHYQAREYRQALTCLRRIQQSGGTTQNIERLAQYLERLVAREHVTPEKKSLWARVWPWLLTGVLGVALGLFVSYMFYSLVPLQPPPLTPPATRTHSGLIPVVQITPTQVPSPTPTASPTLTPTPRPQCRVVTTALNLRSGPGLTYTSLDILSRGTVLLPLGRDPAGQWIQVQVVQDRQLGWVSAGTAYVSCNMLISGLPVMSIPPTPTATATLVFAQPAATTEGGLDVEFGLEFDLHLD